MLKVSVKYIRMKLIKVCYKRPISNIELIKYDINEYARFLPGLMAQFLIKTSSTTS